MVWLSSIAMVRSTREKAERITRRSGSRSPLSHLLYRGISTIISLYVSYYYSGTGTRPGERSEQDGGRREIKNEK